MSKQHMIDYCDVQKRTGNTKGHLDRSRRKLYSENDSQPIGIKLNNDPGGMCWFLALHWQRLVEREIEPYTFENAVG